jgi:hypothetical protein
MSMIERFVAQYRLRRMFADQSRWISFWGALSDLRLPSTLENECGPS